MFDTTRHTIWHSLRKWQIKVTWNVIALALHGGLRLRKKVTLWFDGRYAAQIIKTVRRRSVSEYENFATNERGENKYFYFFFAKKIRYINI